MKVNFFVAGRHQEDEEEVLQLGRGHAASRDSVLEEVESQQRRQAQGGHQGERHSLLRLRVHEGEPLPAHEREIRELWRQNVS